MVGDLGLGKSLDMSSRLTMVAGTPTYVAPEQAAAQAPDARADQYSLAALAFLLLTGRPPFTHTSLSDAMNPGTLPPVSTPERPFPPAVEQVLHRGLARSRDDRYPTVTEFVDALAAAARPGRLRAGDPAVARPRPGADPARSAAHRAARRGRRCPSRRCRGGAAAGSRCSPWSGSSRWPSAGEPGTPPSAQLAPTERTVEDAQGTLSVTVPAAWDRADARDGWNPPNAHGTFPALSVGTSKDWATQAGDGEGVFVALLPGTELPEQLPAAPRVRDRRPGHRGQPGRERLAHGRLLRTARAGASSSERVVLVAANTLLWVQIRSDDRAVANQVLDDVHTHGI